MTQLPLQIDTFTITVAIWDYYRRHSVRLYALTAYQPFATNASEAADLQRNMMLDIDGADTARLSVQSATLIIVRSSGCVVDTRKAQAFLSI